MAATQAPCTAQHLNHVCIAVRDVEATIAFYAETFGLDPVPAQDLPDQGIRACLLRVGSSQLELIEPTEPDGPIARFIERRGEGLHHVAFEVENIDEQLQHLQDRGVDLIDKKPRVGLAGTIAFLHPKATRGVLIELVQKE